ncbi:uncharacterized protein LOC131206159 [Anopheles bellator]|uniref:uncharacterized protein LOC131206159 n=1 Tax=Anopheles bellator TaxID=139047 RepID=UPI002649A1D4|nr:uncharacterized protein LOC131206159 [Anopheles bellator]
MDKYLRLFIKYQVYTIVMFTSLMIALFTPVLAHHDANSIEDLRLGGVTAVMFASGWFTATVFLVVAIHKEDKRCIYPYAFMFALDLVLLILREIYVMIIGDFLLELWSIKITVVLMTVPYVTASLLALHRLYTVDPIVTQRSEGFVRFERNETSEPTQVVQSSA